MDTTTLSLIPVRQQFPDDHVADVSARVRSEILQSNFRIRPGARIAIAVGSRGISDIASVVASTVDAVRSLGGEPFIVPAMGSHGGATAAGQTAVLQGYGVHEAAVGAPVISSMETVEIPRDGAPCRVFMDRHAYEADGVVVVNRVKSHTDFRGHHESGIVKMLVIGLGKHAQALEVHRSGVTGLREHVPEVAKRILRTGKVVLGIGLVENAHHNLAEIRAVLPDDIHSADHELLELSRSLQPHLPSSAIDVLVIDRIGKDISGTCMDTTVIGRMYIAGEEEPPEPRVRSIVTCRLTPESHGNAVGVGLADVITRELYDQIDIDATAQNVMTSSFYTRGKIPLVAPTARDAFLWAARSCGPIPAEELRVVRIRDTLSLGEVEVSTPVWNEIAGNATITRAGGARPVFTEEGSLAENWSG